MRITHNGDIVFICDESTICENELFLKRGNARFNYYIYRNRFISPDIILYSASIVIIVDDIDVECSYYYSRKNVVNYYDYGFGDNYAIGNKVFNLNNLSFFQQFRIGRTEKRPQLC